MERHPGKAFVMCGLPSSGNKIIGKCLNNGTVSAIMHGLKWNDRKELEPGYVIRRLGEIKGVSKEFYAVIPVRDSVCQRKSGENHGHQWTLKEDTTEAIQARMIKALIWHEVPYKIVSYEGFVAHPTEVINEIFKWMGVPGVDSPCEEIVNANEKHK